MIVLFIKNQIKLNSILKTKRYYRPISVLPILSKIAERHGHNAFYRPSTDYRPTIDRPSTDYHRPTIGRLSTDYRPTVDRLSTDCRPLYRPLCRPISQSTLPTVNKIQKPAKEGLSRYRLCTRILTTLLNFVLLLQLNESGKAHLFIRPSLAFFIF